MEAALLGVEGDGLAAGGNGFVEPAGLPEGRPQVVVDRGVVRLQPDRLPGLGNGLVQPALPVQGDRKVAVRSG